MVDLGCVFRNFKVAVFGIVYVGADKELVDLFVCRRFSGNQDE